MMLRMISTLDIFSVGENAVRASRRIARPRQDNALR